MFSGLSCARGGRFIPAGAGNILNHDSSYLSTAVHPRGCGEHHYANGKVQPIDGSSPRVRGTYHSPRRYNKPFRFIPAGAGNISPEKMKRWAEAVHPRGCGEHFPFLFKSTYYSGSSPRVRGTFNIPNPLSKVCRFIPAGAGNMGWQRVRSSSSPVHPRGCGEHWSRCVFHSPSSGSSPRVRGTCTLASSCLHRWRFIPAGAGNIGPGVCFIPLPPVHPRGCGEHLTFVDSSYFQCGSSPRVRGTFHAERCEEVPVRFIPAGAGNISCVTPLFVFPTVHPRGCGEHHMYLHRS